MSYFGRTQIHDTQIDTIEDFPLNQTPETSDSFLIALLILFLKKKLAGASVCNQLSDVILP